MSQTARETALDWFARLQAAENDTEIRRDFRCWYEADPAHAAAFDKIAAFWDSGAFTQAAAESVVPGGAIPLPVRRRPTLLRIAASVAALLALWLGIGMLAPVWRADYRAATGQRLEVALADGSRAVLNSGSAIAAEMTGPVRKVRVLSGEAYFEVVHDPDHPFVVDGGALETRVLGTRFAVRADRNLNCVAVRSGLVQVTARDGAMVRLSAGQSVTSAGDVLAPVETASEERLAWLDGTLVFHDRPLAEVLTELDRYHSGLIVLANADLGRTRVSGHYRLDNPAAVAESLARVVSGQVAHLPGAILIIH